MEEISEAFVEGFFLGRNGGHNSSADVWKESETYKRLRLKMNYEKLKNEWEPMSEAPTNGERFLAVRKDDDDEIFYFIAYGGLNADGEIFFAADHDDECFDDDYLDSWKPDALDYGEKNDA